MVLIADTIYQVPALHWVQCTHHPQYSKQSFLSYDKETEAERGNLRSLGRWLSQVSNAGLSIWPQSSYYITLMYGLDFNPVTHKLAQSEGPYRPGPISAQYRNLP